MSEPGDAAPGDGEPEEKGDEPRPSTCCAMRRKVVVGILGVLPEGQSGVPDSELADFMRFDLSTPDGKPVLAFRYCPWCGAPRAPDGEVRVVDVRFGQPDEPPSEGFEPPTDYEPPSTGSGEGPTFDGDPPSSDGENWK